MIASARARIEVDKYAGAFKRALEAFKLIRKKVHSKMMKDGVPDSYNVGDHWSDIQYIHLLIILATTGRKIKSRQVHPETLFKIARRGLASTSGSRYFEKNIVTIVQFTRVVETHLLEIYAEKGQEPDEITKHQMNALKEGGYTEPLHWYWPTQTIEFVESQKTMNVVAMNGEIVDNIAELYRERNGIPMPQAQQETFRFAAAYMSGCHSLGLEIGRKLYDSVKREQRYRNLYACVVSSVQYFKAHLHEQQIMDFVNGKLSEQLKDRCDCKGKCELVKLVRNLNRVCQEDGEAQNFARAQRENHERLGKKEWTRDAREIMRKWLDGNVDKPSAERPPLSESLRQGGYLKSSKT